MNKFDIKEGSIVAFNNLSDAVWYNVLKVDGFVLTIREQDTDYQEQYIDKCFVKQVKNEF